MWNCTPERRKCGSQHAPCCGGMRRRGGLCLNQSGIPEFTLGASSSVVGIPATKLLLQGDNNYKILQNGFVLAATIVRGHNAGELYHNSRHRPPRLIGSLKEPIARRCLGGGASGHYLWHTPRYAASFGCHPTQLLRREPRRPYTRNPVPQHYLAGPAALSFILNNGVLFQ